MAHTTPAQIRRAQRTADRLTQAIAELRRNLPEPTNAEQSCANGALYRAFEALSRAESALSSAARHLADKRTEQEIRDENSRNLAEELRERTIRIYGCAND